MYGLSVCALCPRCWSRQKACPGTLLQITPFPPPLSQTKLELKKPALQCGSLGRRRATQLSSMLAQLFFHLPPQTRHTTFRHRQKDAEELCLLLTGSVLLTLPLCLLDSCFLCLHLKPPGQKMDKVLIETENTFRLSTYSIILKS